MWIPQSSNTYSVSKINPPSGLVAIFSTRIGIFTPNLTRQLGDPVCARLLILIQLPVTSTKLCHIKPDHPVHTMCAKCQPSAETRAGIF